MVAKLLALALLPLFVLAADEKLETLNDIIISGNTVGGDINVHGHGGKGHGGQQPGGFDGGNPETPSEGGEGVENGGEETFSDGCSVVGQTVHECDGSQRLMTATEKRRMNVRLARKQQKKRNMRGRQLAKKPLRKSRNQKARRDMEEGGSENEEPSPCQTCSTGAMKAMKKRKH